MPVDLLNSTSTDRGAQDPVRWEWDRRAFENLGMISAALLLTPFMLWTAWHSVKGWGRWRLRKSGNRPHYVRTWHGWVETEKAARRAVERAQFRNHIRQKLAWRTTTADYSWVFWDPRGAKRQEYEDNRRRSMIRHLPRWTRSYEPGSLMPDARITPNRLEAAAEGKVSLRSFPHSSEIQPLGFSFTGNQSWLGSISKKGADTLTENHTLSDSLPMMTGALADSRNAHGSGTVRKRIFSRGRFQAWNADSPETFRATCTQFWVPKQTGNSDADVDPARESGASALRVHSSPTCQSAAVGLGRRTSSLPLFATLRNAYHARCVLRNPVETLPVRSHTRPTLYPARVCDDDSAPENPDDLQGSGQMMTRLRNPEANLHASMPPSEGNLMQIVHQRFEPLAKTVVLNPFISIGTEYSGTAGRPGSPNMGWTTQGEPRAAVSELSQYEAGSVKGASSFSCSSCSSASLRSRSDGEYPNMHSSEASLQQMKDSPVASELNSDDGRDRNTGREGRRSDGFFQGSYLPGKIASHFSLLPRNTFGEAVTLNSTPSDPRSGKVTPEASSAEQLSDTERLSMLWHLDYKSKTGDSYVPPRINPKYTIRLPFDAPSSPKQMRSQTKSSTRSTTNTKAIWTASSSGTPRLSKAKNATIERTGCLSSLEKTFLADLDLRLGRLDYELTPGFRGPQGDGTSPKWWFEAVPYAASVASRGSQSFLNHATPRLKSPNPPPILGRSHTTLGISKTIDKTVSASTLRQRASSQDLMPPRGTSTYNGEPGEGSIDTAAWMLRRPPMGALREDPAEKLLLFTSGRGPAKTLLDWQQSQPLLPLQQAFDSAAAISRRSAKHLKRLGLPSSDRNDGCKDEKQPVRAAFDNCKDVGNRLEGRKNTTTRVTQMTPIQRKFTRVSVAVDERAEQGFPMGYSSPNRTMMH